jgi:hypothetical protein
VSLGALQRLFAWQEDGTYLGLAGESAALTKQAGAFRLPKISGEVIAFHAVGTMDFVEETNPAILTNVAVNTLDAGTPSSHMLALPAQSPQENLVLRWDQADEAGGSGVSSIDIFMSVDGAPPMMLLNDFVGTTATIPLVVNHVYSFYSEARDGVGHEELPPLVPDATVRIVPGDTNSDGAINILDLNRIRNNFGQRGDNVLGDTDDDGDVDIADLNNVRNYFSATAPLVGGSPGMLLSSLREAPIYANSPSLPRLTIAVTAPSRQDRDGTDSWIASAPVQSRLATETVDNSLQDLESDVSRIGSPISGMARHVLDLNDARDCVFEMLCTSDAHALRWNTWTTRLQKPLRQRGLR